MALEKRTAMHPPLKILSYNIHKGFNSSNLKFTLKKLKESIESVQADIVFLQEVVGHHEVHKKRVKEWPLVSQFEYLADHIWPHFAYGKNAVYPHGHHGNAILSKYPISQWENIDISTNRLENRGLLHVEVHPWENQPALHLICLHLSLFESGRQAQLRNLCDRIAAHIPPESPLIVAGDFNDWREKASLVLKKELHLDELFLQLSGQHAKTFPSWMPALRLDRIYTRFFQPLSSQILTQGVWSTLSDHAALFGELKWNPG